MENPSVCVVLYSRNIWKLNERMVLFLFNRKIWVEFLCILVLYPSIHPLLFYAVFYISQFIMTVDKSASFYIIMYHASTYIATYQKKSQQLFLTGEN